MRVFFLPSRTPAHGYTLKILLFARTPVRTRRKPYHAHGYGYGYMLKIPPYARTHVGTHLHALVEDSHAHASRKILLRTRTGTHAHAHGHTFRTKINSRPQKNTPHTTRRTAQRCTTQHRTPHGVHNTTQHNARRTAQRYPTPHSKASRFWKLIPKFWKFQFPSFIL